MELNKLTVNQNGVWLNGNKIDDCDEITIKDINPIKSPVVTLRVTVDEVDVKFAPLSSHKLREERKNTD